MLYEKSAMCSCAPAHRQYFCGGLSQPFRWDSFVGSLQSGSCSMGVGLDTQYLPQCRAHTGQSERFSRLAVAQFSRFKQLETLSGSFPFPNADPRPLRDRPLCGSLELLTSPVFQLETRPNGAGHGSVSAELVNVSPFLSNHELSYEAESGRGRVYPCHSSVAYSGLVPKHTEHVNCPTSTSPVDPQAFLRSSRQSHPLVVNHTLQLAAWHVYANPCKREEFQGTLPSSSWQLGGRVQTQFITSPGAN